MIIIIFLLTYSVVLYISTKYGRLKSLPSFIKQLNDIAVKSVT